MLYVGMDVDPNIILETFGVSALTAENMAQINSETLHGTVGQAIGRVIAQLRKDKGIMSPWQPIRLIRPRSLEETYFIWHLVEDRLGPEDSYVGFLCSLHKAVHKKMEEA